MSSSPSTTWPLMQSGRFSLLGMAPDRLPLISPPRVPLTNDSRNFRHHSDRLTNHVSKGQRINSRPKA